MVSLEDIKNGIQHWIRHPNPWVVALIVALISSGTITYLIMQPNVVYEKLPTYLVAENATDTTKQQPSIRSVTCVVLKNTGNVPAHDVIIEIESLNFFPDRTELHPEIWKLYCSEIKCEDHGANFAIYISAPEEEPKILIDGMYDGGKKIEMEKTTFLREVIVIVCSFILGFVTCFVVIRLGRSRQD
jgi:hypothetical protein